MSSELPHFLSQRVARWMAAHSPGSGRAGANELSAVYRTGNSSGSINLGAYLTTRMPATYAACSFVFGEIAPRTGELALNCMLDIGAGPGTAAFAALNQWRQLAHVSLLEPDKRFANLARELGQGHLPNLQVIESPLQNLRGARADLVTAVYVLAELPLEQAAEHALNLWHAATELLVLIEPGTPQGFARIRAAREGLLAGGANVVGPCTHANNCPMTGANWCHFKTRLARSRAHLHAKNAKVPFEDEALSWIAVARPPVTLPRARIIGPPRQSKPGIIFEICGESGLTRELIATRQKARYKVARKLKWGEAFELP